MANVAMEAVTVTGDAQAYTGKGDFYGCYLAASGDVVIQDDASSGGPIIFAAAAPGGMLAGNYVRFNTGLRVDLTTATEVTVYFVRR